MRTLRMAAILFGCLAFSSVARAQVLPVEIRQDATRYNLQSADGMPISSTTGNPAGSNGKAPTEPVGTVNQFQSLVVFGGLPKLNPTNLNASVSLVANAQNLELPRSLDGQVIMLRAKVGGPLLSSGVTFLFGAIIPPPDIDEFGVLLTNVNTAVDPDRPAQRPEDYWAAEPHTTVGHTNSGYYWSPHAQAVFAINPGPLNVVWRRKSPSIPPSPAPLNAGATTNLNTVYTIFTNSYIVSGSPVKTPRKIYWTEGPFHDLGRPVNVPSARVRDVNIVYNNAFPREVAQETVPSKSPVAVTNTLWLESTQGAILAYNREGRVFVELLGDTRAGGPSRQHLGFEIVDVFREPGADDVTIELGERLTAWQDGRSDTHLRAYPISQNFTQQHTIAGSGQTSFYATRETQNQNDLLVHWVEYGVQGLEWPFRLVRYRLVWPDNPAKYSHYVRPEAADPVEAKKTAVTLPLDNVPTIAYQDPDPSFGDRAKLEADKFYTFLDANYRAHRTLLSFTVGENIAFERVFSWYAPALISGTFNNTVTTSLTAWNSGSQALVFADELKAPRVINQTVAVGQRIEAPSGETGGGPGYWAGHIQPKGGTAYSVTAYADPFVSSFEAANKSAIIPVNAIPGALPLEVWWFRKNAANLNQGFKVVYWPSVVGRYTVQWPANPREIVLASNDGSGGLSSLEAQGFIYTQNDPQKHGYNPNEEHALMLAGQAYALRDDLNITSGASYSSEPFVLLQYTAADGRPTMSVFKVLREKPAEGIVFDYLTEAGTILQAPMPLPLLEKPVESGVNYNAEPPGTGADLPVNWSDATHANGPFGHYRSFTYRDRKENHWVYRAFHGSPPALEAGRYDGSTFISSVQATAVAGQSFSFTVHASRRAEALVLSPQAGTTLPPWLTISGQTLTGQPSAPDVQANPHQLTLKVTDADDGSQATFTLALGVVASGTVVGQGPIQVTSLNSYASVTVIYFGRPPYLAASAVPTNSFTMRFYYKTLPGFAWPGLSDPPPDGSVVPYLRPKDASGNFIGRKESKETASLDIVYRPVWPVSIPTLRYGDTLTAPKLGLPAVRGQTSAQVLYQRSVARDITAANVSVVLHDPTREKSFDLASASLTKLPAGVRTDSFQGKLFFPGLPPHLSHRVFVDPARGTAGHLVLRGQFVDDPVGEKYLLLNVVHASDISALQGLCPTGDPDKSKWDTAVLGLATTLETFVEDTAKPGTFIPDSASATSVDLRTLAEINDDDIAVDSYALSASGPGSGYVTLVTGSGRAFTPAAEPVSMHIIKVSAPQYVGQLKVIAAANPLSEQVTLQHTVDLAGRFAEYEYEWRIAPPTDGLPPTVTPEMTGWTLLASGTEIPRFTLGGAGIQSLTDNYVVMRYRPKNSVHPLKDQWTAFTPPQLVEGWIKRVLAGINPFNQRLTDLFNNRVNTDVSLLTQAGRRWEGDVALNLENINDFGLVEIYETVLRRGRQLSIDAGINYGPANDALLLAAGYLNDLYMMLGNEAFADAANPTIGIGTQNTALGDVATALFAFKGQVASVLEEELALLRGRDDFLQPGVEVSPVYNRLFWNYTRGIDAGEVIYAINYNIKENPNASPDGVVNAEDASLLFPQGHGDAYGHYLTALKGYYELLLDTDFDWVPRTEAVTVLGQPVQVDFQDERKFAAAAAAVARSGRQVFDLTWRMDYQPGRESGWQHFEKTRENSRRVLLTTRYWGLDHWASRVGQGTYLNWIVGNAVLPEQDTDPNHEGIQKIDRKTVPELKELAATGNQLQTGVDSAEAGLSPLGLAEGAIAFDINPYQVTGGSSVTHFEQTFERARIALNNALVAFDDAKNVTRVMRSEGDSLVDFQARVAEQELAYLHRLIEVYGTPYPDDIGPGKTYSTGYSGPDLLHYQYVDLAELTYPNLLDPAQPRTFRIDTQQFPADWSQNLRDTFEWIIPATDPIYTNVYTNVPPAFLNAPASFLNNLTNTHYIDYELGPHGFFGKPAAWQGKRKTPGKIQQAISGIIKARNQLYAALNDAEGNKAGLDKSMQMWQYRKDVHDEIRRIRGILLGAEELNDIIQFSVELYQKIQDTVKSVAKRQSEVFAEALPKVAIFGTSVGGDATSIARAARLQAWLIAEAVIDTAARVQFAIAKGSDLANKTAQRAVPFFGIEPLEYGVGLRETSISLSDQLWKMTVHLNTLNQRLQDLDDAQRAFRMVVSEGDRVQSERETFRRRAAAVIQGYRTRDAAFRIFRNEKLERYKTLFDLAAQYTYLAANAYDYETGLLHTQQGKDFINRIVRARALGVVSAGQPQFAGSNTGDPGLSSALAEMYADWLVLKGRLGFNNPDGYGTTTSLRTEHFRLLPGPDGDQKWQDVLHQGRKANLLDDEDVRRYCMQIDRAPGLPVPGIVLEFSTTIANGLNLFGRPLAAGDQTYSPSSFATKIFAVGVALEGYRGMADPAANTSSVGAAGGTSPPDPSFPFLDPFALAGAPYVYLIPVGVDSMRSPPLGDASVVRTWSVQDVTIPLPFNIGASGFSTQPRWQSSDALTEEFFGIRKHQAFRPVSRASLFPANAIGATGGLAASQYNNRRLIGRSVWNSKWKLIIPGHTLLNDPNEGLDRFIQTVKDVKLNFLTYSYAGN
ncbi:MAG: hypothetical protein HY735_25420 [Verrucomicrobia bacterium]|nr:hypothetical protein [Verrucomicrobiota bacterium]